MFGDYWRALRRFRRNENGSALPVFAAVIVPLLMVVAVAVDLGQILLVKRQLAGAVDAAALTLGTLPALGNDEAQAKAVAYVRAHYNEAIGPLASVTLTRTRGITTVTAAVSVPMTFLRVAGYDTITVSAGSQSIAKANKLEVVMVLDNSGSMAGSKMSALKAAANTLVDTLMGAGSSSENVRIGVVPFTGMVNVGPVRGAWWLDETTPSALNYETITQLPAGVSLFKLFDDMHRGNAYISWRGCIRARDGYDETDAAPDPNVPATLFTPYFWPNEPQWSENHYLASDNPTDYRPYSETAYYDGANNWCLAAPIQPLTNVKTSVAAAINAMTASGATAIPEGLAWGWRVVSPNPPLALGVPYAQTDTVKAIILMTDGENAISSFSAYGYATAHLGRYPNQALNEKLARICNNIKAVKNADGRDAIVIYTILFDQPSQAIRTLLGNCASEPGNFFDSPTHADLQAAFEEIGYGLNHLRLSR